ncbi:MAG: DUF4169 family protein [Pseudomonadota bacterium]
MGEVVNLRLARKARARIDSAARAAANRAKFGRTRAERDAAQSEEARMRALLDSARREDDAPVLD